ncbi:MAG: hypothetical protein ACTHJ3_19765 [Pararhizobium sp.]
MRECDIMHEAGDYWVARERDAYVVYRPHNSYASTTDSAYAKTPDGLAIAKARCDYLARRAAA